MILESVLGQGIDFGKSHELLMQQSQCAPKGSIVCSRPGKCNSSLFIVVVFCLKLVVVLCIVVCVVSLVRWLMIMHQDGLKSDECTV